MKKEYDVLTALDICVDCIVTGNDLQPEFGQTEKLVGDYTVEMGGSNCIFACQCAKLNLRTIGAGVVGQDIFGDLALATLGDSGVDITGVDRKAAIKTGLGISFCVPGDRAIMTYLGTLDPEGLEEKLIRLLPKARHLHIGSYYLMNSLRPHYPEIVRQAKKHKVTVSLDVNWDPTGNWDGGVHDLLRQVDIFFPNENEALAITGEKSLDAAMEKLRSITNIVALKRGEFGSTLLSGNLPPYSVKPLAVRVIDAIGAGDSFDAGFLSAFLSGKSLEECLHWGNICGSMNTRAAGGVRGQIRTPEISEHLAAAGVMA